MYDISYNGNVVMNENGDVALNYNNTSNVDFIIKKIINRDTWYGYTFNDSVSKENNLIYGDGIWLLTSGTESGGPLTGRTYYSTDITKNDWQLVENCLLLVVINIK